MPELLRQPGCDRVMAKVRVVLEAGPPGKISVEHEVKRQKLHITFKFVGFTLHQPRRSGKFTLPVILTHGCESLRLTWQGREIDVSREPYK